MFVIFIGPPGVGKGTQAKRLVDEFEILHLSTGELLRAAIEAGTPLGKKAQSYMDQGQLVPDEIMVDLIDRRLSRLDCENGCLLDGFPRTVNQAKSLDHYLFENDRRVDVVIALTGDAQVLTERLLGRAKIEKRSDDTLATIVRRLEVYHEQTEPVIEYYRKRSVLRIIDGMATRDEVYQRIRQAIWNVREA